MCDILIPIGRYACLVDAVLNNMKATNVDLPFVVFVTAADVEPELEARLSEVDDFRWLRSPVKVHNNHLPLLDWAIRQDGLSDQVVIQHADCFHRDDHWLERIVTRVHDGKIALSGPCKPKFHWGRRPFFAAHDYLGFYDRRWIVENGATFNWGRVSELPVSDFVLGEIEAGQVRRDGEVVGLDTWLDGSQLLGLEMNIQAAPRVQRWIWHPHFHAWQFFKWANRVRRDGNKVLIRAAPKRSESLLVFSLLSSWWFPRDCSEVVPWGLYRDVFGDIAFRRRKLEWLVGICPPHPSCLGEQVDGLELVWLGDDDSCRFGE